MYALFTKTTNPEVTLPFAAAAKLLQSCLTMCDPTDSSPPGSPVPGTLKARTLESRFYIYIYTHASWRFIYHDKSSLLYLGC